MKLKGYIRYTARAYLYCPIRDKFLFTRGILPPFGFHTPGGGIDEDEGIVDALRRELYEELAITSIDITAITYLYTEEHVVYGIPHVAHIHFVVLNDQPCSIPKKLSWEVPGYIWRDLSEYERKKVYTSTLPLPYSGILKSMKRNIGQKDRWARAILALILALVTFLKLSGVWMIIGGLISVFIMYQAVSGWCLLYQLMGKNTCPIDSK